MKFLRTLFLALLTLAALGTAHAQVLYGANGGGANPATVLVRINPATGATTTVGPIGFAVTGLAMHPTTGVLYGSTGGAAAVSPNSIIRINTATGAGTLIGPTGLGGPVADLEFRSDGTLFGWSEDSDDLVTINTGTGVATVVGDSGVSTRGSGLAFVGGTLYFAGNNNNGPLRTVNPATGLTVAGPNLSGSPGAASNPISALATGPGGVLFGVDLANAGAGVQGTAFLITIDRTTGVITNIGQTIDGLDAIAFAVVGPFPAGAVSAIPTLSEWGIILLALLIAAAGIVETRRRRS